VVQPGGATVTVMARLLMVGRRGNCNGVQQQAKAALVLHLHLGCAGAPLSVAVVLQGPATGGSLVQGGLDKAL